MSDSFRGAFMGFGQDALDGIRERNQEHIDDTVFEERMICINKATSAMIELGVNEEKIIGMLQKYWDLRLSEAMDFINNCKSAN